jgi:hypothetical protein
MVSQTLDFLSENWQRGKDLSENSTIINPFISGMNYQTPGEKCLLWHKVFSSAEDLFSFNYN